MQPLVTFFTCCLSEFSSQTTSEKGYRIYDLMKDDLVNNEQMRERKGKNIWKLGSNLQSLK